MRVLIYGGRDYRNEAGMFEQLDRLHAQYGWTLIINGGQVSREGEVLFGADYLADQWAVSRGIPVQRFYANWLAEGKAAGPIRNT